MTEAVGGEGGRLYNSEGERFMERYSPRHMELDARDVVAPSTTPFGHFLRRGPRL